MRVLISSHFCQNLQFPLFFIFYSFIIAILVDVKWYLPVVLICISVMLSIFSCATVWRHPLLLLELLCSLKLTHTITCITFLEKCKSKSLAHFFFIRLSICCWVLEILYIFWDINTLSNMYFANIFTQSVDYLFTQLIVSIFIYLFFESLPENIYSLIFRENGRDRERQRHIDVRGTH